MPQPFNYALNVPDPTQAVLQGVQLAQGIAETRGAQAQAAGIQAENDRRVSFQKDLAAISAAPTAAGYASLAARYPETSKVLKESYDLLSAEEQQERIRQASGVYSALASGEPEFAQELLTKQAEAYRNGGREKEAKTLEDLARLVEMSPETAQTTAGLYLATNMGADKFVEGFSKLEADRRATQLEGATLSEAEAKAEKAAVDAKFAESNAAADLAKKGWDVKKIQNDIVVAKENARIAAISADIAKEGNDTRKGTLQLKRDTFIQIRDEKVRERVANAESARASIDNLTNTVDRALATPIGVMQDVLGPVDSKLPTFGQAEADFEELVETMSSQTFLAMVPNLKGTGSLSNAEGEKLQAALQSLSKRQSPERLINNLKEVQRLMLKARANITTRYGVPETIPDTPDALSDDANDAELDALLQQYGGQ
jgi:hypothetical protein